MALTFDEINAITNALYLPKFPQLVFDRNIIMNRLWKKGSKPSSGEFIKQPVMYKATKGGAYSPYEVFDVSAEDQITAARFDWKYYEVPITLSRDDILKNDGPEGVKKLMDAKMKLAGMKMSDDIATDLWDGTTSDSSKNITSIALMCDDNAGTLTSGNGAQYGNITRTDMLVGSRYTWDAKITSAGAADLDYDGDFSGWMNTTYMSAVDGDIHPTIAIAHNDWLDRFWKDARPDQRFLDKSMLAMGWVSMSFNGIPFVADLHLPAYTATDANNRIYFLNEEFLDFVSHSKENMRFEPFAKPIDQNVSVAHVYWAGNMTTSACHRHAVLYNMADA